MRFQRTSPLAGFLVTSLAALLWLASAADARAQLREPLGETTGGWAPVGVGVRVGTDNQLHDYVAGALLWIPLVPSGVVQFMPNMDVTFVSGANAYEYNIELAYLTGGREGGLYAGGGIGFRKARFSPNPAVGRESARAYTVVLGVKLGGFGRLSPQIETRWVFVNKTGINPQQLTIGASVALWDPRRGL
jgi:hypothetical protein